MHNFGAQEHFWVTTTHPPTHPRMPRINEQHKITPCTSFVTDLNVIQSISQSNFYTLDDTKNTKDEKESRRGLRKITRNVEKVSRRLMVVRAVRKMMSTRGIHRCMYTWWMKV